MEHPQIENGFDTEPRVGYPLEVYETAQLSFLVLPCKLPLVHVTKAELRKINALPEHSLPPVPSSRVEEVYPTAAATPTPTFVFTFTALWFDKEL